MKHLLVLLKDQSIFRKEKAGECVMLFGMKKEKKRAGDMQGIVHALQNERATCGSMVHWQTCLCILEGLIKICQIQVLLLLLLIRQLCPSHRNVE